MADDTPRPHKRRSRYRGKNPRAFHEKYKELDPLRYGADVEKVLSSGKTPAGSHRPIMVDEILECLRPVPGEMAVDATLGGGGHARAILERILPAGRLIGLDVDPIELPRTEARLRSEGFGPDVFTVHHSNFAGLARVLAGEGLVGANVILADLGVSSMQLDNPDRGFGYKESGALDMRMNPHKGLPASQVLARTPVDRLARLLEANADEPHADSIAAALKATPIETTGDLHEVVCEALTALRLPEEEKKASVRRTFQALRIAVNDEFATLDWLLRSLPELLAPGGRVAILTFHSGEDRRVKKALQSGHRDGLYASISGEVIRPSRDEVRANPRASSAKLRWAIRSAPQT
ncbi:MAG: 16S rRNA (cytosine(1402)-N(4))-methyltransferase RsmH [Acidobacteriota bacterium]|nr:16S rRNA (cytosine(1402)-N(4))-methyltransferase RsmH [Acidobacteriota bacterium]MDQ3419142.1 16S rRNA (cytosine(1402)-N(4))-methyltransferase RsmH [Acidobacteriota bacterium]